MKSKLDFANPKALALGREEAPILPLDFQDFNQILSPPLHPETRKAIGILDYQMDYFNAWQNHHKVILNKSRKIGATETALRIIMYNILTGAYADHGVMIVAGNKQTVANKFIQRLTGILKIRKHGFTDLNGVAWGYNDIITSETNSSVNFFNNTLVEAFPAGDSTRGIENTICIFMSEAAFIDLLDDRKVYNAVKPNIANITNADFILESTPNGKRGFYYDEARQAQKGLNEFHYLEQPYTVAVPKLLSQQFIENEKKNTKIDFDQEYGCKFTSSQTSAFKEESLKFAPTDMDFSDYSGDLDLIDYGQN